MNGTLETSERHTWPGALASTWAALKSSSSTSESVGCACTLNLMSCRPLPSLSESSAGVMWGHP